VLFRFTYEDLRTEKEPQRICVPRVVLTRIKIFSSYIMPVLIVLITSENGNQNINHTCIQGNTYVMWGLLIVFKS
jgi:hypothetical protein